MTGPGPAGDRRGMFGINGSGDTSGYGRLVRPVALSGSTARPFGGLVYRQAMQYLHGVRDEAATRELIACENRHYAKRQATWFKKEPDLQWFEGPGESPATIAAVGRLVAERLETAG